MANFTDIVLIIDAQNGCCSKGGLESRFKNESFEKVRKSIRHIKRFIKEVKVLGNDCIFLCCNAHYTYDPWQIQIVDEFLDEKFPIFWRDKPDENPFDNRELIGFLEEQHNPRLLLCGFYGDMCVFHIGLCAMKRSMPVVFISDCTYPEISLSIKKYILEGIEAVVSREALSLVEFLRADEYKNKIIPLA